MAISLANSSCSPTRLGLPEEKGHKQSMWHRLGLRRWLGRDDRDTSGENNHHHNHNHNRHQDETYPHNHTRASSTDSTRSKPDNLTRRISRRVGVGLPRSTTFKRQNSEHRDRLAPLEPDHRRALSADRRPLSPQRNSSPPPAVGPRSSAPEVQWLGPTPVTTVEDPVETKTNNESESPEDWDPCPDLTTETPEAAEEPAPVPVQDTTLEMELEQRWILNLSMHFRDRSEREKFFVTYAETPTRWRRVTISCDYRGAPPDSLEQDLKELRYQRDKCARIYESIRDSLPEIQFYDTVTNLKVETIDGRLHVHVTEDVNETIPYPPISSIGHLRGARCVPEHFLHFDSHLSGFVYKVRLGGRAYIKKEIPGPDTVDEFLYEINALHALGGSPNVIRVEGIVVDERQEMVKGLLISYAEQGALVDILYEQRGAIAFARRERWAKQIVRGLCEIHESGYVQGDFTLSNIVVDADDNAHIIDINRRGCPVGWEPPEIAAKIESNQRISMYIGVKTDIYQLGMTLWALAMEEDEPERQPRPLFIGEDVGVPDYYRRLVHICLSPTPRHRLSAKELLSLFPSDRLSIQPPRLDRAQGLPNSGLPPLVTKGDSVAPLSLAGAPYQITSKDSFEQSFGDRQHDPSMFSDGHDHDQRSTPTLAGSNGGARFPSGHSSTSTLNHEESHSTSGSWDNSNSPRENSDVSKVQNAVPSVWANAVGNAREQRAPLHEVNCSGLGQPVDEDATCLEQESPAKAPLHVTPDLSSHTGDIWNSPVQDSHTHQLPERNSAVEAQPSENSPSTPSLLLSVLPINPALGISRRSLPLETTNTPPQSLPERPKSAHKFTTFLSESILPINPVFRERPTQPR